MTNDDAGGSARRTTPVHVRTTTRAHPAPDQVVVEVDLCGICGTDLHAANFSQVYRGGYVLGHEFSAECTRPAATSTDGVLENESP